MTTFYLISVAKMLTSDECDIVPRWSAIMAEDNISNLSLADVAKLVSMQVKGAPVGNVRPMTEGEIEMWREAND